MERQDPRVWAGDPFRLPRIPPEIIPTVTGDRRPGARFCAACGGPLEGGVVTHGFWAYCSIECVIRTEREDHRTRG